MRKLIAKPFLCLLTLVLAVPIMIVMTKKVKKAQRESLEAVK